MARRRLASIAIVAAALSCAPALMPAGATQAPPAAGDAPAARTAARPGPSLREARTVAREKVDDVRRQLLDEGAQSAEVPGCWREPRGRVSCYATVAGDDDGLRWKCSLRVIVRAGGGASHRAVRIERPLCSI